MARVGVDDGNGIALALSHWLMNLQVTCIAMVNRWHVRCSLSRHCEGLWSQLELVL